LPPILEGDHADERIAGVGAVDGWKRDDEQEQAERGHGDADPLAEPDLEAEDPLSHDGEDHDAGGEDGLDHRERGVGEGSHVEDPGTGGDGHADREPLAAVELLGRAERVTDVDRRGLVRTLVLVKKAQLRGDGADERQQNAQIQRQRVLVRRMSRDSSPATGKSDLPGDSFSTSVPDPRLLSADRVSLTSRMKIPSRTGAKLPHWGGTVRFAGSP
jgi:hypothetical protein